MPSIERVRGIPSYIATLVLLLALLFSSDVNALLLGRGGSLSARSGGGCISITTYTKLHYSQKGKEGVKGGLTGRQTTQLWGKGDNKSSASSPDGPRKPKPPKDDVVQVNGRVTESLPNAMFRVEIEPSKQLVLATISGKIRKNFVRILVGDSVVVELSAYDLTKGRITFRNK